MRILHIGYDIRPDENLSGMLANVNVDVLNFGDFMLNGTISLNESKKFIMTTQKSCKNSLNIIASIANNITKIATTKKARAIWSDKSDSLFQKYKLNKYNLYRDKYPTELSDWIFAFCKKTKLFNLLVGNAFYKSEKDELSGLNNDNLLSIDKKRQTLNDLKNINQASFFRGAKILSQKMIYQEFSKTRFTRN
ncbi:putative NADH-flavin reductase [Spiroplasma chinense]|uniref:Putative NADH-flavin reductase n=1 Tax=Spiroplasma chinense TaxID=216932 RepID=A0A5B9Y6F1_9MOLU|nr:hypothetical protein [Spiroplasma chinense]QEH61652.1 putative NADH-flavin reductase [Spiroplasma chinense]